MCRGCRRGADPAPARYIFYAFALGFGEFVALFCRAANSRPYDIICDRVIRGLCGKLMFVGLSK